MDYKQILDKINNIACNMPLELHEGLVNGVRYIIHGLHDDINGDTTQVVVQQSTIENIVRYLAELGENGIDICVAGYFISKVTAGVPRKKRPILVETLLRQSVKEKGNRLYPRILRRVPPEYRRDSLIV